MFDLELLGRPEGEGDRLFIGRKFTGHYTLEGVKPADNIVFLSTGTGEAPQNAMIAELFRREHEGRILDVVCVRFKTDLATPRSMPSLSIATPGIAT